MAKHKNVKSHPKPQSDQLTNSDVKISGSVQVFSTEDAVRQHNTERKEDNSYKDGTERHEKSSLWVSIVTLIVTTLYLVATCLIFRENKKSAEAANRAAEVAAKQLDLTERPWIRIDMGATGNVEIAKNGITVPVAFALKNIGHSVANGIRSKAEIIPAPLGANAASRTIEEREKFCAAISNEVRHGKDSEAQSLFVDDSGQTQLPSLFLARSDVDLGLKQGQGLIPMIIVCAAYRSSFNSIIHTTARIYMVMRVDPASKNLMVLMPPDRIETIHPKEFLIAPDVIAATYAD
jgi:hypothetical protein